MNATPSGAWQFWVDRGGTFTDVIGRAPGGQLHTLKLLSEGGGLYTDAALEGIRRMLGLKHGEALPAHRIHIVKIGTTVATNALLERKGARVALVTTKGLGGQLRIGNQNRPKLFVRRIDLPESLASAILEVPERIDASGHVIEALDEQALRHGLRDLRAQGFAACAIHFLHAYRFAQHERRAGEIARDEGFTQISLGHEVSALIKFVGRGDTTLADAYLTPVLRRYVEQVTAAVAPARCQFMMSSGALSGAESFRGKDAVLSGPAGGVVGAVASAHAAGFDRVIGFDMGGTSTDVMHCADCTGAAYERTLESELGGVRLRTPMMLVHTVAAGGGSILSFSGGRMRAGPESAGAEPGPMSYRRGGPLTVTDANLLLGRISAAHFPAVFGPKGDEPLDVESVRAAFDQWAAREGRPADDIAEGFIQIAVENMANAIKRISVQRGYDVTRYVLNCFGGAGGQHACLVAQALGIKTILVHPLSGLLSAYGIGLARLGVIRERALGCKLAPGCETQIETARAALEADAKAALLVQGVSPEQLQFTTRIHIRYDGTDTALPVALGTVEAMAAAFDKAHEQRFGFRFEKRAAIIEWIEVEAVTAPETSALSIAPAEHDAAPAAARTRIFAAGSWHDAMRVHRAALKSGAAINGPALIIEAHQTVVVEPGWSAALTKSGDLVLTHTAKASARSRIAGERPDPVMLEIFGNMFMHIAEEMGATLEKTAASVNIKERLDFSCALYDRHGALIANAPHMPVHLGSMGDSVAAIRARHAGMRGGDVFALNAPYAGGTHLPDVTVVAPVFIDGALAGYTAARGHHADIGGISPGSMPPFSKDVTEEGVLLDGVQIARAGAFDDAAVEALFTAGLYPARNPAQNLADLKAQIAACRKGAEGLSTLHQHYGRDTVEAYMAHVQNNAEEEVRRAILTLKDGAYIVPMDDGAEIAVAIRIDRARRAAIVDFTGTSAQRPNNFNAPASVTKAAVLYCFRCLVDGDMPLNAGCLRPIEIVIPEGSMLAPRYPAAVVAGNVETSQHVTDAIFAAMNAMAASQGSMNNLTFGDDKVQYYETLCGGAGAGPGFHGQSAVHTHMTNSRLTDPEVLEQRFPVRLKRFNLRPQSGGAGQYKGGDGVVREIEFLRPMQAAILSTRRSTAPFGLAGGKDGASGRNAIRRANGTIEDLPGCAESVMQPGDSIIIETPGGGGYERE